MTLAIMMMTTMMMTMPWSGLGALVDVDKLGQTRRSVSFPPLDDVRVGVEGSSRPHIAATLSKNVCHIGFTNIYHINNIIKNPGGRLVLST